MTIFGRQPPPFSFGAELSAFPPPFSFEPGYLPWPPSCRGRQNAPNGACLECPDVTTSESPVQKKVPSVRVFAGVTSVIGSRPAAVRPLAPSQCAPSPRAASPACGPPFFLPCAPISCVRSARQMCAQKSPFSQLANTCFWATFGELDAHSTNVRKAGKRRGPSGTRRSRRRDALTKS